MPNIEEGKVRTTVGIPVEVTSSENEKNWHTA